MKKIKRKCKICKNIFLLSKSRYECDVRKGVNAGKFCSRECFYKSSERSPNKGKFGKNSSGWKGGVMYERGYRLVEAQNHPNAILKGSDKKYIREHRLIMEKHIGRYLTPHEIVHHINGNIQDNRVENLLIMSSKEHSRYHKTKWWIIKRKLNGAPIKA